MSGATFHPNHDELHGITVVIHTSTPRTFIGRWDQEEAGMIRILQATMHEGESSSQPKDDWVAHTKKYGVPSDFPQLTIPREDVTEVTPLRDA